MEAERIGHKTPNVHLIQGCRRVLVSWSGGGHNIPEHVLHVQPDDAVHIAHTTVHAVVGMHVNACARLEVCCKSHVHALHAMQRTSLDSKGQ